MAKAETILNLEEQYKTDAVPDGQNKYYYLIRQLNKFFTPFEIPTDKAGLLVEEEVNDNFNTITDTKAKHYLETAEICRV